MSATRFEQTRKKTGKSSDFENDGAKSGSFSSENASIDPELGVEAWPILPVETRHAILALVEDATRGL
jgi:hypothetical protein